MTFAAKITLFRAGAGVLLSGFNHLSVALRALHIKTSIYIIYVCIYLCKLKGGKLEKFCHCISDLL